MNLVFDTETTGKIVYTFPKGHESQPHIVQLGAQLYDDDAKLKGELNLLIKPDGWTIPEEATAIHGISTADCEKYGIPLRAALGLFKLYLDLKPLLVAHNIDYDTFVIETEAIRLGKTAPVLAGLNQFCTMKNSENLVKIPGGKKGGYKWPKLIETHRHLFGEDFEGAHDAMADVRACARSFFKIREILVSLAPPSLQPK